MAVGLPLLQIGHWEDFDIFELAALTHGRALYTVGMCLMDREQLLVSFCPCLPVTPIETLALDPLQKNLRGIAPLATEAEAL